LLIEAGKALHPQSGQWVRPGLPFGPKPRLILSFLNTEARRSGSPEIEVEDSLTAFVGRLRLDPGGRTIRTVKDQLARLSAARWPGMGASHGGRRSRRRPCSRAPPPARDTRAAHPHRRASSTSATTSKRQKEGMRYAPA
jgi:Plasmid encoded RepA protein